MEVRDARGVGERGLAKPDPREGVSLDQRIFAHPRAWGHVILAGHTHALALAVEAQPVVAALNLVANDATERQRREAVRAAVGERHRLCGRGAEQDDLLTAYGPSQRRTADLPAKGNHLPAVTQPHDSSSRPNCSMAACMRNDPA